MSDDEQAEALVGRIIGRSVWLYASNITNQLSGLVYWMILSSIAGTKIVGTTSVSIGLALLLGATAGLGTITGLQRYLGIAFSHKSNREASEYFWSTFVVIGAIYSGVIIILITLALNNISIGAITPRILYISSIILATYLLYYTQILLISKLETVKVLISTIAANTVKFLVGIMLTLYLKTWVGAALGFIAYYIVLGALGIYFIFSIGIYPSLSIRKSIVVIKAGLANWVPTIIALSGQWLGVIALFNFTNPSLTGSYYIASTIVLAILSLTNSIYNLTLPVLSGLSDQRKRVSFLVLKMALALTVPLFILLFAYPDKLLLLLNISDPETPIIMRLLVIGSIVTIISSNISVLMYAYGKYNETLAIGMSQNLPRVILYYVLTPIMKGIGAALSYVTGSVFGLSVSLVISYLAKYHIKFLTVFKIIVIPLAIALPILFFNVPLILGSIIILGLSYVLYIKTSILNIDEIVSLISELPYSNKVITVIYKIKNIISRNKEDKY